MPHKSKLRMGTLFAFAAMGVPLACPPPVLKKRARVGLV